MSWIFFFFFFCKSELRGFIYIDVQYNARKNYVYMISRFWYMCHNAVSWLQWRIGSFNATIHGVSRAMNCALHECCSDKSCIRGVVTFALEMNVMTTSWNFMALKCFVEGISWGKYVLYAEILQQIQIIHVFRFWWQ